MVRVGEGTAAKVDTSDPNRVRLQSLLTEAARTWSDRLITEAAGAGVALIEAEHYAASFSESYKQFVSPADAISDIAIFDELTDDSVKLVLADHDYDETVRLTWYFGGRTASLSELLPMLQSMGVEVLEERPFTVTRPDGLPVWIYQFKITPLPTVPLSPAGPGTGSDRSALRRRGHRDLGRPRRDRPVQRVGDARRPDVAAGGAAAGYAKYLRQAGFSVQPVTHRVGGQRKP